MPASNAKIVRECLVCGKSFFAKNIKSMHCSKRCADVTCRNKRRALKKEQERLALVEASKDKEFLSILEVSSRFNISRPTLYRWIRQGKIKAHNPGDRMTYIDISEIETRLQVRKPIEEVSVPQKRLYSLEPEDCYTIGEVSKKFRVSESTVYTTIRKQSIPTRQIGRFVYVPKYDIDKFFKSAK